MSEGRIANSNHWRYETNLNNSARFVLGTYGHKPLICIGVNPSTSSPEKLDNTNRSVERLAHSNGYDSWITINLYPQRATSPKKIHKRINNQLHDLNIQAIDNLINKIPNADIWAAWGGLMESRPFFTKCILDIYNVISVHNCKWYKIGKLLKAGHPRHPLYLKSNSQTEKFDIESYLLGFD